jgi:hypothetical protein
LAWLFYFCPDCGAAGSWKETERHNQPTGAPQVFNIFDKLF